MKSVVRYNGRRRGIVLLVAMVVLVVLASIGYMLTARIAAQVHRNQYIIDYQKARYGCDSALKYAVAYMGGIKIKLIDRPNDPDFSDVFSFTQDEYERFLAKWAAEHPREETYGQNEQYAQNTDVNNLKNANDANLMKLLGNPGDINDANAPNLVTPFGDVNDSNSAGWYRDPNNMTIPGPYGSSWPLVMKPVELEVGDAKVTIEIEDENAKLPLVWGTNSDKDKQREVDAAISTFCEWMNIGAEQADTLKQNLHDIGQIKTYKAGALDASSVVPDANAGRNAADPNVVHAGLSRRNRRQQQQQNAQTALLSKPQGADGQISDFVRLLHTSMLDIEPFAQPYLKTPQRTESALKYMSRGGATKVNINSAPRQVLEAAFMFGGDASTVADAVIKERQKHPFTDVNDAQKKLYKFADSIRRSKDFITAASNVFSVKITAVSGVATASATAVVLMDGKKAQIIAILAE